MSKKKSIDDLNLQLSRKPSFVDEKKLSSMSPAVNGKQVVLVAKTELPTRYGDFVLCAYYDRLGKEEHTALIRGEVENREDCPVRVHSQCHTGDVLGSLRCDCRDQLEASLQYLGSSPFGMMIYLRQEGRGIGLLNKIRAYHLQDLGLDTVDANHYLGLPGDARDYGVAARIIKEWKIKSVAILTNNPDKIKSLERFGITVSKRIPLEVSPNRYNRAYLRTKKKKMGHLLS